MSEQDTVQETMMAAFAIMQVATTQEGQKAARIVDHVYMEVPAADIAAMYRHTTEALRRADHLDDGVYFVVPLDDDSGRYAVNTVRQIEKSWNE